MIKPIAPLLFALLLFACKSKVEKTNPLVEKITESVYASGIIKSDNQYQVFANTGGLVTEVFVTEGDVVLKDAPILRISNVTAQLNNENARITADYTSEAANTEKLNQINLEIATAKAKMDNDALLQEKQRSLWAQGIGTHNEVEQRELAYTNSSNAYKSAKLRYADVQKQISYQAKQAQKSLQIATHTATDFVVTSKYAGKIYSVLKKVGEMVNIQNPIAILGDANHFTIELQIDEYDIAQIKLGQKALLTMDSHKGQVFEAVLSKINPLMNAQTKSFTVEAVFTKPPTVLYPNLTTEANIILQVKEKALTIPRNYLIGDTCVLLENKEKRNVTTGLKDYQKVEITSGLTVKDVVLKPVQ